MKHLSFTSSKTFLSVVIFKATLVALYLFGILQEVSAQTDYFDCVHGGIKAVELEAYNFKNGRINYGDKITVYALYSIYDKKPNTLLLVGSNTSSYSSYCVKILPETKRISPGAFRSWLGGIILPPTLRYFPADLIVNDSKGITYIFIDDTAPTAVENVMHDDERNKETKEVARFNLQGIKVDEQAKGMQVIQYDDGSAKKVMKK